ncbi:hypothetical protein ASE96_04165 [Arthrobacter sp. Leaf69]|nr:hypothetical protein ASE96_04165 [Arthrobacter sp. Leaf69]
MITTGEEPEDWPERFAPGSCAKVATNGEGLWTKIAEDDAEIIPATLANNPFGGFTAFGAWSCTSARTAAKSSRRRSTRPERGGS